MSTDISAPEDDFQIRCPRLGHHISFSYCMHENDGVPCRKSLDCWHSYFPVYEYLRQTLDRKEWEKTFMSVPKSKVLNIVELIEKAKEVKRGEKS